MGNQLSNINQILERLELLQKAIQINPSTIASSTNTSPIQIVTSAPHNFEDGNKVTIANHLVNTNANGIWTITVVNGTTISLNGSTGNGIGGATGTVSQQVVGAWGYEPQGSWATIANTPFFATTILGGGPTNFTATAMQWVDETVRMFLCLGPVDKNFDIYKVQRNTYLWRDAVFAMFANHIKLSDPNTPNSAFDFVMEATIVQWDIVPVDFDTGQFAALQFDLRVKERYPLTVGL